MNSIARTSLARAAHDVRKSFYRDDYATILLDDSIPCVSVTTTGLPRHSEHYAMVLKKKVDLILQEIRNYPKLHILLDSRIAGPVLDDDVDFYKRDILPALEKAGVRHLAIIMPNSKHAQLSVREMTKKPAMMNVKYFDSMRGARHWLRKKTLQ
jgi:hypothetical protein